MVYYETVMHWFNLISSFVFLTLKRKLSHSWLRLICNNLNPALKKKKKEKEKEKEKKQHRHKSGYTLALALAFPMV